MPLHHRRFWIQRLLVLGLGPTAAEAQQAPRSARVGWIGWSGDTAPDNHVPLAALKESLVQLGWREGANLTLLIRQGDRDQAPGLVAELVRAGVELIVLQGVMVFAGRTASTTTPMIFAINGDPVEAGLVASYAHPGGNATGITALATELAAKRLELLKSTRPGIRRVAVLANASHPGFRMEVQAAQAAAAQLGLQLVMYPARSASDMPAALAAISALQGPEAVQAISAFPDTMINRASRSIAEFASQLKLPANSGWAEFAQAGNVLSYGPSHQDFYRMLGRYVDKILKGAKAGDLPVELPTRFQLIVNQAAARRIGIALPAALLARADEVIA